MFVLLDVLMTRRALLGRTLVAVAALAALGGIVSETRASTRSASLLPLRARTARSVAAPRIYTLAAATDEPLQSSEWWRADVRVDGLTPPGPGVPITIVDSG